MITNLPVSQIETILMHELYHLKRRDYLVNIMQLFIEGVLFYHPVNYAKALIHIAEQQRFTRLAPGAVGATKHYLKSRINRILKTNTVKTNMRDRVVSLALLAGSLIVLLTVSSFSAGPSFNKSNNMKSEMTAMTVEQPVITVADTIPQESERADRDSGDLKAIEEIDWEKMKKEMEASLREIKEGMDLDSIMEEVETAQMRAMGEIEMDQ